jgi:dTDP-4-amino-4,6-dideoxygalactose transaminase
VSNFGTLPNRDIEADWGFNGKIDELRAACILAMLEPENISKVWKRIQNKSAILRWYKSEIPGATLPSGAKRPSLCVLGNLPARELEERGAVEGIICRRYYPLLSRMKALTHVETVSISPDTMDKNCALPSDVNMAEAFRVTEFVKRIMGV